jgi:acyl dehydratase
MRAEQMIAFAEVYDPEPFHVSAAQAKELGWDDLFASGLMVASIWRRLNKNAFPNLQAVVSPGWDDIRWLRPVYAGDVLRATTMIIEKRLLESRQGEGLVRFGSEINGRDGAVVTTLNSNAFVKLRPQG